MSGVAFIDIVNGTSSTLRYSSIICRCKDVTSLRFYMASGGNGTITYLKDQTWTNKTIELGDPWTNYTVDQSYDYFALLGNTQNNRYAAYFYV